MREYQMKKIIAAAVASAFIAPAFAADVTVGGSQEFSYKDVNGVTTTGLDGNVTITGSTETANGISVSADFNISDTAGDDGGNSITLKGAFGTLDVGDTSSAVDKVDDKLDWDYVAGTSLSGPDAGMLWTLPTLVEGLTIHISHGADNNKVGEAHTGYALSYAAGPVTVDYASNENEDNTKFTYVGAKATFGAVTVAAEQLEDGTSGATSEERSYGVSYTMGDVTIKLNNQVDENSSGTKTADKTFTGIHYSMGGGVTAFVEAMTDDVTKTNDTTAVGVAFAF
jgi:hypothetical protein